MLRLLRFLFLLGAAFVSGIIFERIAHTGNCLDRGGNVERGICIGARK